MGKGMRRRESFIANRLSEIELVEVEADVRIWRGDDVHNA